MTRKNSSTHHSPLTRLPPAARRRLPPAARRPPPSARRGVLLLVVLILLVMFVMMAVTYVLVATRQLSISKAMGLKDATGDPPAQVLDGVMMQFFRDTTNKHSVLYSQSLLEHMYGPYGFTGTVNVVDPGGSNATRTNAGDPNTDQVVEFTAANPATTSSATYTTAQLQSLLGATGYLEGCVITMTSGQAKGLSSRIVRYDATTPTNPVLHVLAFKGAAGSIAPQAGDTFVVNGRAFSGTGAGFSQASGLLDAKDGSTRPFALLPNPLFYDVKGSQDYDPSPTGNPQYTTAYPQFPNGIPYGGPGGVNLDYDAPDYQHMFMSWSVIGSTGLPQTILPSFHRPDLINYWSNQPTVSGNWSGHLDLLRQVMLRPMGQMSITPVGGTKVSLSTTTDHPNFTGSNPNFDAINGPWDVDNDGDGVPDSVWIDAGYPVQMRADGKLYKPLVAILCVDLDGRLNVNAAGTTEMLPPSSTYTQSTHSEQFVGATYSGSSVTSGNLPYVPGPFAGTDLHNNSNLQNQSFSLPRGEGLGPAEINLYDPANPTAQSPLTQTEAAQVMQGGTVNSVKYDGRYGDLSPTTNPSNAAPQAGLLLPNQPTLLGEVMRFQYPRNSFDPTTNNINNIFPLSSFATPSDLWGRMAVGVDYRGQPLFWKPALAGSTGWVGELKNDPYDMNLSVGGSYQAYGSVSADNPFGAFDLERLLRPFDVDSGELPRRLWDLSGTNALNSTAALQVAKVLTTDSWDTSSPSSIAPDYLRDTLGTLYGRKFANNIIELLTARLLQTNPGMTQSQINNNIRQLLSPELIAGLRMNINRPLGDGRDGDNNGVVDEPTTSELTTEGRSGSPTGSSNNPWSWLNSSLQNLTHTSGMPNITLDLVNGQNVTGPDSDGVTRVGMKDQLLARQLLARHLYVLARLMLDDSFLVSANNHWFDNESTIANDTTPYGVKYKMSVRRIAQWAVNVVDFMDPDNIMTPFEYDLYPFSPTDLSNGRTKDTITPASGRTWCVDGIIDGANAVNPQSDDLQTWRGLVWGCERPELLLNETIAFHDRRVKDTNFDPSGKTTTDTPPDPTFDQVRVPQGSAFFELYCTGNVNQPQQSGDLYTYDNTSGQWCLDLGKASPPDASGNKYPVWRLAITGPGSNATTTTNDVQTQITTYPESYSFDTKNAKANVLPNVNLRPSLVSGAGQTVSPVIDRVVWFTNAPPTTGATYGDVSANQIYYRHDGTMLNSPLLLGCGQYAVVGPREVTRMGWTKTLADPPDASDLDPYVDPGFQPAGAKIVLIPGSGGVEFDDQTIKNSKSAGIINYPDTTNTIRPPLAIIAAADSPWGAGSKAARLDTLTGSTLNLTGVGISVSEPLPANYYPEPMVERPAFDGEGAVTDCYGQLNQKDPKGTGFKFLDQPLDSVPGMLLKDSNALGTGTYLNFKTVLLQRLANPLIPYDPKSNPYLTVDWMPIDLTVFNGQASSTTDPDDPSPPNPTTPVTTPGKASVHFATRQRNGKLSGGISALTSDFDIYYRGVQQTVGGKFLDAPPQTAGNDNTGSMVFPYQLKYFADPTHPSTSNLADSANGNANFSTAKTGRHSLGFVDSYFQQPFGVAFGQAAQNYGPLKALEVNNDPKHIGDPRSPFPWLVWNNRPYENVSELMMVPASHPGRLLTEFSMLSQAAGDNIYTGDINSSQQQMPFGHLLNFFNSTPPGSTAPTGAGLSQMFEYLTVPSPFVGTQTVLNPQTFAWSGGTPGEQAMGGGEPNGTAGLHPPFNLVSNYREPGKVNINTITDASVWNAILGGTPNYATGGSGIVGPVFKYNTTGSPSIEESRRGFPVTAATNTGLEAYTFDSNHPSIFSNPFRSPAGADMVPLTGGTGTDLRQSPTNASLWRATGVKGGTTNIDSSAQTLISVASTPGYVPNQPVDAYRNATSNAYFNYQALDRVTSKLTTHSNVYAVWITLGYFEVTPWYGVNTATGVPNTAGPQVFDTAHPDGYQLGAELGSDTGQVERHRAFYIIDRSIPVGYQHGLDNNVNNAVLLKRFIE